METGNGQHILLCWGCGEHGQNAKADNTNTDYTQGHVTRLCGSSCDTAIKLAACGSSHTVVVTHTNDIYVWGNGHYGQLGLGDTNMYPEPQRIQLYAHQRENPMVKGVACGGRHTFVWLENGHMFSFGNNFFAQLGYDFRIKNFKENQKRPHLLRTLTHRSVTQVACGEKHTIMLFSDGTVATVGNGGNGQIGNDSRIEALVPKVLDDMPRVVYVTAGAFHNVIVDVRGEVWTWGYGPGCGRKKTDVLVPEKMQLLHANAVMAAAGQTHSAALTANGNIYTWGQGSHGQLGHGPNVKFLCQAVRMRNENIKSRVVKISCGDAYTAAITVSGHLFMWGKNSHVISTNQDPREAVWIPQRIETANGLPVHHVACGAWHATSVTGKPNDWKQADDSSDIEETDEIVDDGVSDISSSEAEDEEELDVHERPSVISREKTAISLADFYAPSPSPTRGIGLSPSPDMMLGRKNFYHRGLPPPKSLRKYKRKQSQPTIMSTGRTELGCDSPKRYLISEEASTATSILKSQTEKSNQELPSKRQMNESLESTQEKLSSKLKRQVSFDETSDAQLQSDYLLKRQRESNASSLSKDSINETPRAPLRLASSVAVEFSIEDKLRNGKSPPSNELETNTLPELTNNHTIKSRTLSYNNISTYKTDNIYLNKGNIYGNGSNRSHFSDKQNLSKHAIPFVQTHRHKQESMPIHGLGIEREWSIIRPCTIEFPNEREQHPRFRRAAKALRVEPISRNNTKLDTERGFHNVAALRKRNLQIDFRKPTPMLMNTVFANGLREIRHYNNPYPLHDTSRPPLKQEYTQLHEQIQNKQAEKSGNVLIRAATDLSFRKQPHTNAKATKSVGATPIHSPIRTTRLGRENTFSQFQAASRLHGNRLPTSGYKADSISKTNHSMVKSQGTIWKTKSQKPMSKFTTVEN